MGPPEFVLSKETVYYLLFRLLFGKAEGHELYKLFAGDLSDGRLVQQLGVDVVCLERRDRQDSGVVHYYGVALGMPFAGSVSDYDRLEFLIRSVPRDGS